MDIVGFQTSGGSVYLFNDVDNKTLRLKLSTGSGQGEFHTQSMCLFVQEGKFNQFKADHAHPDRSIRLGWLSQDQKVINIAGSDNTLVNMPDGHIPVIAIVDKTTGACTAVIGAHRDPRMGDVPIEKSYNSDGTSYTHTGHGISKLYDKTNEAELMATIDAAQSQNIQPSPTTSKENFAAAVATGNITRPPSQENSSRGFRWARTRSRTM